MYIIITILNNKQLKQINVKLIKIANSTTITKKYLKKICI